MTRLTLSRPLTIAAILSCLAASSTPAQRRATHGSIDQTFASAIAARHIVERGILALGGQAALDSVNDIERTLKGVRTDVGQGPAPNLPYTTETVTHWDVIEPKSGRFINDITHTALGYARTGSYNGIIARDRSGNASFVTRTAAGTAPATLTGFGRPVPAPYRYPEMLLSIVLNRAPNLRSLGISTIGGRKMNVVAFPDGSGTTYTLSFDAQSGRLTRVSWLVDDPQFSLAGELPRELTYSDYRPVGTIKAPFHYVVTYGGEPFEDLRVTDFTFNTHPADSLFAPPASLPKMAPPPANYQEVSALAPDVYFVRAPYNSMFVVFNDYVLVLEAPLNDFLSQTTIAAIKKTAPGKPIRYVVPTHFHHDHLGGIRGFIAEGATVVTTPGIRTEVERYASTPRELRPDRLALHPQPLHVETFNATRVFDDGTHRVEIYNVGPNPHANDLVVAYIPVAKTLYEADALDISDGPPPAPADVNPTTADFARKLRELGLDVETIIPTHGRKGTMDDLRRAVPIASDPR